MGLFQAAYETYETFAHLAGKSDMGKTSLAPVGHITASANLEITVDQDGHFVNASAVEKTEPKIIIPATEQSAGRSGTQPSPHPLCDQLQYLASYDDKRHAAYLEQLQDWVSSPFSHPKLLPILHYIEGNTILSDLRSAGLVDVTEDGIPKGNADKYLIRWRVVGLGPEAGSPCWTDPTLFQAFQAYITAQKETGEKILCMVTGETTYPAVQHMKGIVPNYGNAKLISSNDKTNFTYRGRFSSPDQAATIGYLASQKAHNALRWLMANQGVMMGDHAFLCWSPQGVELPQVTNPFFSPKAALPTPSAYQEQLHNTLKGWQSSLPDGQATAVIASFDAATSGRLSVTYFNELQASDFLLRLHDWDQSCCWYKGRLGIRSPSLFQIINCAYGTQRKEKGEVKLVTDDKLLGQQLQHLISCRIDRAPIPTNILRSLVQRVFHPQSFEPEIYQSILFTTCAVIKKYDHDRKKEEWSMALEPGKKDRSYQYGRLLAVLEKAEKDTFDQLGETERQTNAFRMLSAFSMRPHDTAKIIWEQVEKAYYPRLRASSRNYYDRLLGDIMDKLSQFPDEEQNRPLDSSYVMGYYLQQKDLYTKHDKKTEDENDE